MKRKNPVWEDDGRTVADMSDITRRNLLLPRSPRKKAPARPRQEPEPNVSAHPWEDTSWSRSQRAWYALGALKAALVIALVFLAGLGLVVLLFLWMGNAF